MQGQVVLGHWVQELREVRAADHVRPEVVGDDSRCCRQVPVRHALADRRKDLRRQLAGDVVQRIHDANGHVSSFLPQLVFLDHDGVQTLVVDVFQDVARNLFDVQLLNAQVCVDLELFRLEDFVADDLVADFAGAGGDHGDCIPCWDGDASDVTLAQGLAYCDAAQETFAVALFLQLGSDVGAQGGPLLARRVVVRRGQDFAALLQFLGVGFRARQCRLVSRDDLAGGLCLHQTSDRLDQFLGVVRVEFAGRARQREFTLLAHLAAKAQVLDWVTVLQDQLSTSIRVCYFHVFLLRIAILDCLRCNWYT